MARGSLIEKAPSLWQLRWDETGADGSRRQKSCSVRGSRRDAQRVLTEKLAQAARGPALSATRLTVAEFLDQWYETWARHHYSPNGLVQYETILRVHVNPAFGSVRLTELRPLALQRYFSEKREGGRADGQAGGLGASTLANHYNLLNRAFGFAVRWGLLADNPVRRIDPPRQHRQERPALDLAGLLALLPRLDGRLLLPVLLATLAGLREGEISGLKWEDVDWAAGLLTVRRQLRRNRTHGQASTWEEAPTKGKQSRVVLLAELLKAGLLRHLEAQERRAAELGALWQRTRYVCCGQAGEPWPPIAIGLLWYYQRDNLGCAGLRFHDLRHSFATIHLGDLGTPVKVVAEMLGHKDAALTLRVYQHVQPAHHQQSTARLDAALKGLGEGDSGASVNDP